MPGPYGPRRQAPAITASGVRYSRRNIINVHTDHDEIRGLAARFADAISRRDYPAFTALWADTATWVIDPPVAMDVTASPDQLTQGLRAGMDPVWSSFVQFVHHSVIDVRGDQATARAYVTELGVHTDGSSQTVHGYYDDDLVRTPDGWRYAARRFHFLYLGTEPIPGRWADKGVLPGGN